MMTKRDIGKEILEGLEEIQAGKGKRYHLDFPNIAKIRHQLHLSQSSFAAFMGISVRTLQEWEQGRRKPSGPAIMLLKIAQKHPDVFTDL